MDESQEQIKFLCEQLALTGAEFSFDEVEEIMRLFKNVALKLIVTNVPREVYISLSAKEAFEELFKSLDPQSTFLYLPSFSRAQVFMTKPEAALCARLKTQGWRLPASMRSQDMSSPPDDHGIRCYIDQMDNDIDESDESEEVSRFLDEGGECTCDLEPFPTDQTTYEELSTQVVDWKTAPPLRADHSASSSFDSLGDQSSHDPPVSSPERENTSEASGDDASAAPLSRCPCPRHGTTRGKRMKHLAPPKPPRLFLLSPPASPPVGWAPKPESEPVINYDLLEALASLAPGEAFELHPEDPEHSRPSIVITPCEPQAAGPRPQIVQTRRPERK